MIWKATFQHKTTGQVFSEYRYDLHDLEHEIARLTEHGHTVLSGAFPIEE